MVNAERLLEDLKKLRKKLEADLRRHPASVVHGSVQWRPQPDRSSWGVPLSTRMLTLPFKLNQDRRHHIPPATAQVTNWPAYDASLRQRGSLTVWFTDEAMAAWAAEPRTTRGGQPWYSPLAILTALTLRTV